MNDIKHRIIINLIALAFVTTQVVNALQEVCITHTASSVLSWLAALWLVGAAGCVLSTIDYVKS